MIDSILTELSTASLAHANEANMSEVFGLLRAAPEALVKEDAQMLRVE